MAILIQLQFRKGVINPLNFATTQNVSSIFMKLYKDKNSEILKNTEIMYILNIFNDKYGKE